MTESDIESALKIYIWFGNAFDKDKDDQDTLLDDKLLKLYNQLKDEIGTMNYEGINKTLIEIIQKINEANNNVPENLRNINFLYFHAAIDILKKNLNLETLLKKKFIETLDEKIEKIIMWQKKGYRGQC